MDNFIYVFSETDRDKLLERGFKLLQRDERQTAYIFINDKKLKFDTNDILAVTSDTLVF